MIEFNATFIVAMFSFIVFIMIMNAIFYNPILGIIRKREEYISSNYEDSKRFDADAIEYKTTYSSKIEQVQEKCRHEFRKEIEHSRVQSIEKVNEARQRIKLTTQDKKDELNKQAQELKNTVGETVVKDLASVILSKFSGVDTNVSGINSETIDKVMN